jgi:hypothetical protein
MPINEEHDFDIKDIDFKKSIIEKGIKHVLQLIKYKNMKTNF